MKAIKSNMGDLILDNDDRILHCPGCGAEYSGNKGDYFMLPDDHIFRCECGEEMELVTKVVSVRYV